MKTVSILVPLLCLLFAPAAMGADLAGSAPCAAPTSATPAAGPFAQPNFVSLPGDPVAPASCSANCGGTTISCPSGTTSCSAVDRNCSVGQRGYVICNGSRTDCPTACPTSCSQLCFSAYDICADNCSDRFCIDDCRDDLLACLGQC